MATFQSPDPVPKFPVLRPGYSMHMKPSFSTSVLTSVSGVETRCTRQAYPLWEFDLTFEELADETQNTVHDSYRNGYKELQQLCGLFLVCQGQYGRFYYSCPEDYSRTNQLIGIGDGARQDFFIVRTFGTGDLGFTEPVGGIDVDRPYHVYVNAVEVFGFTVSNNTGFGPLLEFSSPPAANAVVTMDFEFFYFCRFIEDIQDFDQFYHHLWQVQTLKFRSAKR